MAVRLRLNSEVYNVFSYAMKKAKIEVTSPAPYVELTRENYQTIIDSIKKLHAKILPVKGKTPLHMERIYGCERILEQLEMQRVYFPPLPEPANTDSLDETSGKGVA